jgi:protein-S-isoprenylcysteine O-methyltransferase Ste14
MKTCSKKFGAEFSHVAYGDWGFVLLNILLFAGFLVFFLVPRRRRDWLPLGICKAFLVTFFTEMYGAPLTLYALCSISAFETHGLNPILEFLGLEGLAPILWWVGVALILAGIVLVFLGWVRIYRAGGALVREGIYGYSRHPQYLGIILMSTGFLACWPTLPTLAMWPVLLVAYYRLARLEEREMVRRFGRLYRDYRRRVPMFFPLPFKRRGPNRV